MRGLGIGQSLRFEDGATDEFRDLWNDGVSEGSNRVQLSGKPIAHSHARAVIRPFSNLAQFRQPGCFIIEGASWFAVFVGVANNP